MVFRIWPSYFGPVQNCISIEGDLKIQVCKVRMDKINTDELENIRLNSTGCANRNGGLITPRYLSPRKAFIVRQ